MNFEAHSEIAWTLNDAMAAIESQGWFSFTLAELTEQGFRKQLVSLAPFFGKAVATREHGVLCDTLSPIEAPAARSRSLSKIHAMGDFPLHVDTAHWLIPSRFLILACITPGSASRRTLLLDTRRIEFNAHQSCLLYNTPLRVVNGRKSFFSTILSRNRTFVRLDPGCMTAITPEGESALAVLKQDQWPNQIDYVQWETGKVLIMDNWRVLHGREHAHRADFDRKLLRVTIL